MSPPVAPARGPVVYDDAASDSPYHSADHVTVSVGDSSSTYQSPPDSPVAVALELNTSRTQLQGSKSVNDRESDTSSIEDPKWQVAVPVSIVMGLLFGLALEKGRVFEPQAIVDQMLFERFIMLKMFLSALTAGSLFLGILSALPATKHLFDKSRECYEGCIQRGYPATAAGAFVLGAGMAVSGACPGMVLAQLGSGVTSGVFVFLGGLVAVAVYAYSEPYLRGVTKWQYKGGRVSVDAYLGVSYSTSAFILFTFMVGFLVLLEWLTPWKKELVPPAAPFEAKNNFFTMVAWPPYVAGAIIGFNQLPAVIFLHDTLGSSSAYATLVANVIALFVGPTRADKNDIIRRSRKGIGNFWQLFYVLAVILGSAGSALMSDSWGKVPSIGYARAFLGGFMILFGSRFAGGCTSGHGISGAALLYWLSWVAVPAMFGGGIATAFLFYGSGSPL